MALIRAVNVGGTGKLPMATLKSLCEAAGFTDVRTYLASGNVVFRSRLREAAVRRALEAGLTRLSGKPVAVFVRTAAEMTAVAQASPFKDAPGRSTVAIFLNAAPPAAALAGVTGCVSERVAPGRREIYVAYGDRMADTKLRFPGLEPGTARNMNTVGALAARARELDAADRRADGGVQG